MSEWWTRLSLETYRLLGRSMYPFMGPFLAARARKGKEDRERRYERYGYPSADKPAGPLVWFHAASVGESLAVLALVERVDGLGLNTIITTGTVTSANLMRARLPAATYHQYVPLDLQPAVARFLDHWRPDLAVFTESEIWPTTVRELKQRRIPQVLVNARMSDRSYKRWSGASTLAENLCDQFAHVIAQSELDAERFRKLGARPVTVSGNLKVDTKELPFDRNELKRLAAAIGDRPVWVAASTHKGEEAMVIDIHRRLMEKLPNLLTIIVPRHPERGDEVERLVIDAALECTRRSRYEQVDFYTQIYLGDTIGEMGLYLRLAPIVFMGKSLASFGGQNPLEPAAVGTAILSGEKVDNFHESYDRLLEKGGVRMVADENALAEALHHLFDDPDERNKMIEAALMTVNEMRGALDKTIELLDCYVFPLTIKSELEEIGEGGAIRGGGNGGANGGK